MVDRAARCPMFFNAPWMRVYPGRIVGRHPHDQAPNLREHGGASRPTLRVRPFPRDELPVPAPNRIGRDNRGYPRQDPATETRTQDGQAPPVVVGQPHTATVQLRFEDAVLFPQILHHLVLFAVEPGEERRDEQVHRYDGPSLRHAATAFSDSTGCPFAI